MSEPWRPVAWKGLRTVVSVRHGDGSTMLHHPDCPYVDPAAEQLPTRLPLAGVIEHARGRHNLGYEHTPLCEECLVEHDPTLADREADTTWRT